MAKVCESKLLADYNIDGHALCYYWDFCHGFGSCPCLVPDSKVYTSIGRYMESLNYPHPSLDEVLESD